MGMLGSPAQAEELRRAKGLPYFKAMTRAGSIAVIRETWSKQIVDSQSYPGMWSHDNVQNTVLGPDVQIFPQGNLLPEHMLFANTQGQKASDSMPPWWDCKRGIESDLTLTKSHSNQCF